MVGAQREHQIHLRCEGKRPVNLLALDVNGNPLPIAGSFLAWLSDAGYLLPDNEIGLMAECVAAAGPDEDGCTSEIEA